MFYPAHVNERKEQVTTDSVEQDIINGQIYRVWDTSYNIAPDSSFNLAFVPSGSTWKVKIFLTTDCSMNLWAHEDISWNTNGTELTARNFNRESSNTCSVKVYAQPDTIDWNTGTLISKKEHFVNQPTAGSAATNYGVSADEESFILHRSKLFVLSFHNSGEADGFASILLRITDGVI